jgi:hypothetical protein
MVTGDCHKKDKRQKSQDKSHKIKVIGLHQTDPLLALFSRSGYAKAIEG